MSRVPGMTGDPHTDARLEAWRPERSPVTEPLDRLPAPGRERRARIALAVLGVVVLLLVLGYLAVTLEGMLRTTG